MWRKKCNNPLHQKQLDGKANNISCPRGGEGKEVKRGRAIPFNLSYLSPRGLNTQAEWATEYHCLSLPTILKGQAWPACIASVSVRFRSKERGTRVKDRAKNGASKFFGSCFISRAAKTENPVPRSFFAPKPNGNPCYAGYHLNE